VHRVVCPFTPQLSLVLINRPRRDGTLSWRWCTAASSQTQLYFTLLYYVCLALEGAEIGQVGDVEVGGGSLSFPTL